jgi:GNAT superfamily N-acetyltransferase
VVPIIAAALIEPTAAQLIDVAEVFDQYRQHYAQPVVPGQTLAWLIDHAGHGRLTVFTAHIGENLVGLATTVALPASLRLRCYWQLRDLYVMPTARRRGAARALLAAVRAAATAAGAIRLSVQTEPGNTAALQLYRANGFVPVEDLRILMLPLQPGDACANS